MRRDALAFGAVVCLAIGFAAGYVVRGRTTAAQQEDYALTNVLHGVAHLKKLQRGDTAGTVQLVDVSLHMHLSHLLASDGAIRNSDFAVAKVRTLSEVSDLWTARPPFTGPEWQPSADNASWLASWRADQDAILAMLARAKQECAKLSGSSSSAPPCRP
jgi:hypothetical protein